MEYQQLGQTQWSLSRIGFGGLAISSFHYGQTDDQESIQAIRRALELGVNLFDTADIYGLGHSEKILAQGLEKIRDQVFTATKVGVRWDYQQQKSFYDLSYDYILQAAEQSLQRLRIPTIPLYQIHYPDSATPISQTMKALQRLQAEHSIQYIGCTNFSPALLDTYQTYGRIESLQAAYNIVDQNAEHSVLPACQKWHMGFIAYSPLAQGLLTGNYSIETKFDETDRRNRSEYFTTETFEKIVPLMVRMREIGSHYGKTPTQIALRWILDNPAVTCVIVGVTSAEQIEEAVGAADWRLSPTERKELTTLGEKALSGMPDAALS